MLFRSQGMADATSGHGAVPPSTSQTTSTKTAPSTPASAGATTTATPPVTESHPETPLVVQSSSGTGTPTTVPQAPPAPQKAAPATQLNDEPAKSSIDYSRLRISDDKSFSEAYIEVVELNDQSARLKDEEQLALRSLQMIHNVSSLTCNVTSRDFQFLKNQKNQKLFENYKYFDLKIQNHACMHHILDCLHLKISKVGIVFPL